LRRCATNPLAPARDERDPTGEVKWTFAQMSY
jgi:hypothetical protein